MIKALKSSKLSKKSILKADNPTNLNQTFKTYAKYLPKSVNERATFLNDMEF